MVGSTLGLPTIVREQEEELVTAAPLAGLRVVDLSIGIGGAYATKMLVDAGADFLAVCQAVWGKDDAAAAVQAFEAVLA